MDFMDFYNKTKKIVHHFAREYAMNLEDDIFQEFYLYTWTHKDDRFRKNKNNKFKKNKNENNDETISYYELPKNYFRAVIKHLIFNYKRGITEHNPQSSGENVNFDDLLNGDEYIGLKEYADHLMNINDDNSRAIKTDEEIIESLPYKLKWLLFSRQQKAGCENKGYNVLWDILVENKSTRAIIDDYEFYDCKWFQRFLYNTYAKPYKKLSKFIDCVDNNNLSYYDDFTLAIKNRKPFDEMCKQFDCTLYKLGGKLLKYFRYMQE